MSNTICQEDFLNLWDCRQDGPAYQPSSLPLTSAPHVFYIMDRRLLLPKAPRRALSAPILAWKEDSESFKIFKKNEKLKKIPPFGCILFYFIL
jgi:hypothetical protein